MKMKKLYLDPEFKVVKFNFGDIMTEMQDSSPEVVESSGNDVDTDDLGG